MDPRFSPQAIEVASDRELRIAELAREVERIVQPHVKAAMRNIVAELNALGHELAEQENDGSDCICFETNKTAAGLCFYICHDSTVSAGWRP